ncbi:MAG: hypothetical protein ACR2PL_07545 [Dehalococcoidia bacterium]
MIGQELDAMAETTGIQAEIELLRCERDEARRECGRAVAEQQALREVARTVGSTLDVEAVLEAIVAQASTLGNCAASIFQFDKAAAILRLQYTAKVDAFPAEPMERFVDSLRESPFALGEGHTGRVAATRAPLQIADSHQLPPDAHVVT